MYSNSPGISRPSSCAVSVGAQSSRHTPCAVLECDGTRSVPTTFFRLVANHGLRYYPSSLNSARGTRMAVVGGSRIASRLLPKLRPTRRAVKAAFGVIVAALAVFALGEVYLRVSPPGDIAQYLPDGDRSGPF